MLLPPSRCCCFGHPQFSGCDYCRRLWFVPRLASPFQFTAWTVISLLFNIIQHQNSHQIPPISTPPSSPRSGSFFQKYEKPASCGLWVFPIGRFPYLQDNGLIDTPVARFLELLTLLL